MYVVCILNQLWVILAFQGHLVVHCRKKGSSIIEPLAWSIRVFLIMFLWKEEDSRKPWLHQPGQIGHHLSIQIGHPWSEVFGTINHFHVQKCFIFWNTLYFGIPLNKHPTCIWFMPFSANIQENVDGWGVQGCLYRWKLVVCMLVINVHGRAHNCPHRGDPLWDQGGIKGDPSGIHCYDGILSWPSNLWSHRYLLGNFGEQQ